MKRHGRFAFLSFVISTALLGCNDNNNDSRVPPVSSTTTLKGVVLGVGVIQGATVCLDKNDSLTCESGEPQTVSNSQGEYTLPDIPTSELTTYPVIASVTTQATDLATPKVAIQKPYTLTTPIGQQNVISPLTSLVAEVVRQYPLLTAEMSAKKIVKRMTFEEQGDILLKNYMASTPAKELAHVVIKNLSESTDFFNKSVPKEKASARQAYTLSIRRMLNWIPHTWQFKDYTTFSTDELMTSTIGDFYDIEYLIKTIPQKSSQKIDEKSRFFTVERLGKDFYQEPSRRLDYIELNFQKDAENIYNIIGVSKSIDVNQQITLLPASEYPDFFLPRDSNYYLTQKNRYYLTESGASLPMKNVLTASNHQLMEVNLSGISIHLFYPESLAYSFNTGFGYNNLLENADATKTFPDLSAFYILQQVSDKVFYTYDATPVSTANNLSELKQTGVLLPDIGCGGGGVTIVRKEPNGKRVKEDLDRVSGWNGDLSGDENSFKLNTDGTLKIQSLVNRRTIIDEDGTGTIMIGSSLLPNRNTISSENIETPIYLTVTWQQTTLFGHPAIVLNPPTQCPNENQKFYVELNNHVYAGEVIPAGTVTQYPLFNQTAFDAIKAAIPL